MVNCKIRRKKTSALLPDMPTRTKDLRNKVKADLVVQDETGGTLCGVRSEGPCVVWTKGGDRTPSDPV